MKNFFLILTLTYFTMIDSFAHEMQHGFIISPDNIHFSHLVANGHHSHQVEITGRLIISDPVERKIFEGRSQGARDVYFLFQAQKIDLAKIQANQILEGHIIESKLGAYTPENAVVTSAQIEIEGVHLNIPNPFFSE